ncbi:hypothetical protein [[Clostridium] hylemonae]|uniref:Uncharacterized protein n=1 Tax=[Clostridium] hylemonae DSM 15053 TaxID=553973 RepID=C0C6G2_9FIRM|nr:hypothetical protein [[Clostridium] hylemonae]EEG72297.1 hypothetical protein CLOHYLEM_07699 [[Clostridium] hylemonae DSM 15053]
MAKDRRPEGPHLAAAERSEADEGAVAAGRAGIGYGDVISNNIPESL